MSTQSIITKPGDPCIYLLVNDEWYKYNPKDKPLGAGSMGTVYLGTRCKTGEKIAVKRVKDQYSNMKQVRERAKLEASLAFHHPNLVEMIGYCEYAPSNGPIFILSKFVPGTTIRKYIEQNIGEGENRLKRIAQLVYPVLDALSYIHSKKFVHRDVKPANIMVANEDNVRLMDLGIARLNGGNKFSAVGFIGTPQYSSPEQILRGVDDDMQMGATTDIYSMGVSIFELFAGYNPYKSRTEAETLARQIKMRLPADKAIPWNVMKVLRKATEKDPTNRYQSIDELKVALRNAIIEGPGLIDKIRNIIPIIK